MWVLSGVPQGSVLGPLLFLIMLLDIDEPVKMALLGSYADDTKLWQIAHRHDEIQNDVLSICSWVHQNNMKLNSGKFEHLHIGRAEEIERYLADNDEEISLKRHIKDLGIYISSDFSFDHHIENMVGKAETVSAWILRTFQTREKFPLGTLLRSLLVPTLEYGCMLWNPNVSNLKMLIENVQRKFTSRISEFNVLDEETGLHTCHVDYWERLKQLKVYSLERRRERYIIIFMYKIITQLYPNPGIDLSGITLNDRQGTKIPSKFDPKAPQWVQRLRTASFFSKGPRLLETVLPFIGGVACLTEDTPDVDKFKEKLDKLLETIPDQPTVPGLTCPVMSNSILDQIRHRTATPIPTDNS